MLSIQTGSTNPILRAKSQPIEKLDSELKNLIAEMKETVKAQKGLGLAAPQIGKNIKLVVLHILPEHITERGMDSTTMPVPPVLINPEVIDFSAEEIVIEEGCLSLPKIYGNVLRPKTITLTYQDEDFKPYQIEAEGLLARVIQHEVDHLNGILFIDKIASL